MSQKTDKIILILLLGGSGKRFNSRIPKQYIRLPHHSFPLFLETIINFRKHIPVNDLILVGNPEFMTEDEFLYPLQSFQENEPEVTVHTTSGGESRHDSFLKGTVVLAENYQDGIVLVHDANRPHITPGFSKEILKAIHMVSESEPCFIPIVPSTDSLCQTSGNTVEKYLPREKVQKIQTPQILHARVLHEAIRQKSDLKIINDFTDEGSFMSEMGYPVKTYPGDITNIKITYPEDT